MQLLHKAFKPTNLIPTFGLHPKINSHYIGKLQLKILNKMQQHLDLDVNLIANN
jgi:hypothetical protein